MIAKRRYRRKAKWEAVQNILFAALFIILIGGVVGFFIYNNLAINSRRAELEERRRRLETQVAELQVRQIDLEVKIQDNDSQVFQEKILREQGLFQRAGEEVITILLPEAVEETESAKEKRRVWWNPLSWF